MYLVGAEVAVRWVILPSDIVISRSSLGLLITSPNGGTEFVSDSISESNYTAHTTSSPGLAVSTITPSTAGLWSVSLVIGDEHRHKVLSQVDMFVFEAVQEPVPYRVKLPLSSSLDRQHTVAPDIVEFSSSVQGSGNTLDFIAVFASTTPYPYIPDKDKIAFGSELSGTNTLTTIIINKNMNEGILFSSELAGTNALTQVVVNKNTGRDELVFGAEVAGVNTLTPVVVNKSVGADNLLFSPEIAGTNTLVRVVLEDDGGSDSLVFDSSINASSVNTLITI